MGVKTRYTSIFLAMVLLISMLVTVPVTAQSPVGYVLSGTEDNNEFTLNVSIENVVAAAGRIAISFDAEKLELKDTSSFSKTIQKSSNVVLTQEGLDTSVLVSNEKGHVMFAWYPTKYTPLDATSEEKLIASIPFAIKDGYSTADFTRNTFGIRYVNTSMVSNWDCGAMIAGDDLVMYTNTASSNDQLCNITFDYPNCDYVPIITYDATIFAKDLYGNPISNAIVEIDDLQAETDSNGAAVFSLEDGVYTYRILADGYQTATGYVTVNGNNVQKDVLMKSYEQLVQAIADELEIEFTSGDDAANVTAGIGLPDTGDNGAVITWESSNPDVVTTQGIVIRQEYDVNVKLTATILLGTAVTKRSFDITVRSDDVTEETNTAIVRMDAESLAIAYAPGDSADSVTASMMFTGSGKYGSTIIWESTHPEIVDAYGSVFRPEEDTVVTVKATILRGNASETRSFKVTVKAVPQADIIPEKTDTQIVNEILSVLEIGYSEGDSADSVTNALTLPYEGADGAVITWKSSLPAVVTAYGGIVRQWTDCSVTLTAVVTKGDVTQEKVFEIVVKAAEEKPINPDTDTENPAPTPIPTQAPATPPVQNPDGTVVSPTEEPAVTPATPVPAKSDKECVAEDKGALKIIYAPGDKAESVTAAISLPSKGENGSSIFWESSAPEVVSVYGSVTRPDTDKEVTLTAVILKGNVSETMTFTLKVRGKDVIYGDSDQDIAQEVANNLEITYSGNDNANRVTKSIILPTVGAYDTTITWTTSNKGVIAVNGTVTRKSTDMEVTLTATVHSGDVSVEKVFVLTVPAAASRSGSSVVNTVSKDESEVNNPSDSSTPSERFTDLGSVPWAKEAILTLANDGIINGTSDTEYSPQNPIRRGDFVILLVKMLGLESELGEGFADVDENSYYYEPITVAKTLGIISGIGDNKYNPDGNISRQDMITITYRALDKLGRLDALKVENTDLSSFSDAGDVADYAYDAVAHMVGSGTISGSDGKLNPNNNTTRAETAVFLYKIYQNQGR